MEEEPHCPKGWEIKYSQSKEPGRPYYVRISDGHRQWEPPSEYSWEIVAAVIVLAAVGLYPGGAEHAEGSGVLTHNGCTCAPFTYDGDHQIGAGCVPEAAGAETGWCDVEPGCDAARDAREDHDGWDTCTPPLVAPGGAPDAAGDGGGDADSGGVGDDEGAEPDVLEADAAMTEDAMAEELGDGAAPQAAGGGQDVGRRCSDVDPCPEHLACELDEKLDYSVCVARADSEGDGWVSMFQAKEGTPVQRQQIDRAASDAVRAKMKKDPDGVRSALATQSAAEANGRRSAGKARSPQTARPKRKAPTAQELKARAETAARAREAAAAAERQKRAAEAEASAAAERAAQEEFERQLAWVAWLVRWSCAVVAGLVIFETSPSLHNGFYQLCVWLLCAAHCCACLGSWLCALGARCCGRSERPAPHDAPAGGAERAMVSVVVAPASMEGPVPWRSTYRHLLEQTSQHDRTELIFVCPDTGAASAEGWGCMPRCRIVPHWVQFQATDADSAVTDAFRAGAAAAHGACVVFVTSDVLLPADYDGEVRAVLGEEQVFAGTFGFGVYPRAQSLRIQQEEQAIERLESRLASATMGPGREELAVTSSPFSPAATHAAAMESELLTRRQRFRGLIRCAHPPRSSCALWR